MKWGQRFPFKLSIVSLGICDGSGDMSHRPPVYMFALHHPGHDIVLLPHLDGLFVAPLSGRLLPM